LVHDLRAVLRLAADRAPEPTAVVLDARTLQSSCESGPRAGYDGAKRRRGSKVHMAVDTLGHLLALRVTPANAEDRAQVGEVVQAVQELTGDKVEVAYVDQGYTGEAAAAAAAKRGVQLEVVKLPEAKRGFVLLPRRSRGGALLCLDGPVSAAGARLRAVAHHLGRSAFHRLRLPDVGSCHLALSDLLVHDTV
jgi:transposase